MNKYYSKHKYSTVILLLRKKLLIVQVKLILFAKKVSQPEFILFIRTMQSFSPPPSVSSTGIDHKFKDFSLVLKLRNQPYTILHVDIIVDIAMIQI